MLFTKSLSLITFLCENIIVSNFLYEKLIVNDSLSIFYTQNSSLVTFLYGKLIVDKFPIQKSILDVLSVLKTQQ